MIDHTEMKLHERLWRPPNGFGPSCQLWGVRLSYAALSPDEVGYLKLIPAERPTVQWLWSEMDRVWGEFGLDNTRPLSDQRIEEFYSHPIWLVNGIFTAADPESAGHRKAIATYIRSLGAKRVADYGGGFGQLALDIVAECPNAAVSIIEPFPSRASLARVGNVSRVQFVEDASADSYDLTTAEDVLEHVEDPVGLAYRLASSVHVGGTVIFANCFWPVIACHLPRTFHLRHTFAWVMAKMGLQFVGRVPGAFHAQVFHRTHGVDLLAARRAEAVSKVVGSFLNRAGEVKSAISRKVRTMDAPKDSSQ